MNSLEALEKISWRYVNEPTFQEWCNIIKQDLERLEQVEQENEKLKQAIEILKLVCSINCDKTLETERQFFRLTKEEYELLKEVLEND